MRFLIVNTDYAPFISELYAGGDLADKSYAEQHQVRMASLFAMADHYSTNLRALGHEAWDVIANIAPMQRRWALENGLRLSSWQWRLRRGVVPWVSRVAWREWLNPILAAQVRAYRPDVLYSMAIETIGTEFLRSVKGYYRLAVMQHAAPIAALDYRGYDLALSSLPNQVDFFRNQGMRSELFRLGFEPHVLNALRPSSKMFDVVFVGGLTGPHATGATTLERLCEEFDVAVWGYDAERLPESSPIRRCHRGHLWGRAMYQALSEARIVFNRHIDIAGSYANNMRLYEATGVGALLLTDKKRNLADLFQVGREVAAYDSPEECAELARHYVAHEEEREAIARAGQARVLRDHTYAHRMSELVEIVRRYV